LSLAVIGVAAVYVLGEVLPRIFPARPEPSENVVDAVLCGRVLMVKNLLGEDVRVVVYAIPAGYTSPSPVSTIDLAAGEESSLTIPETYTVHEVFLDVRYSGGSFSVEVVNTCGPH